MTWRIAVVHGPNLNLLGTREPSRYGRTTLAEIDAELVRLGREQDSDVTCFQSNGEGELVTHVQTMGATCHGFVINAAAYTHTSVALHDAIKGTGVTLIELHISNVHAREAFRHHSFISPVAKAVMACFGVNGYALAIAGLAGMQWSPFFILHKAALWPQKSKSTSSPTGPAPGARSVWALWRWPLRD